MNFLCLQFLSLQFFARFNFCYFLSIEVFYIPNAPVSFTTWCLSSAMHSIGQSIKSPECPCVRASVQLFLSYLSSSSPLSFPFSLPLPSLSPFIPPSPSLFPLSFFSLLLSLSLSLPSPCLFLFSFFLLSFRVNVRASSIWGAISP